MLCKAQMLPFIKGNFHEDEYNSRNITYCKIHKIYPRAYIFQRPFLRGLFVEGLIFGGAYIQWEMYVTKSIWLACSWKANEKITFYRTVFAFFYFAFQGNFQV